jgi:inosine-uridine nucleoside N-ribohydrolase
MRHDTPDLLDVLDLDPVAQANQFTLDPPAPPARILPSQPDNQIPYLVRSGQPDQPAEDLNPTTGLATHDYNLWVDAPAAQTVLDTLSSRIFMTGHEATKFVPLTETFRQRLAADRTTPAADTVYPMASNPLLVGAEADNQGPNSQGIAHWWDVLDAVTATFGGIVSHEPTRVGVIQNGENEGRLFINPDGPLVHYGTSARTDRFHQTFLDLLNARHPQET